MSFTRIFDSGLQIAHFVQGFLLIILVISVLLKKQIPYLVRLGILISITMIAGIVGFFSYGLMGQGQFFLTCAVTFACVFSGKRLSITTLTLSALIIIMFMYFYVNNILQLSFSPDKYLQSPTSWITMLFSFVLFIGMVLLIIKELFNHLTNLTNESMNHVGKIKNLKETLEDKMITRASELSKSNRDKDRILGVVAHDINNKLGCIMGYLEMLHDDYHNLSDENRKLFAKRSFEASALARDIVAELLEFAKINSDNQPVIKESTDISFFVKSTVECHIPKALEKNVTLLMPAPSGEIICDINKARLSRVIDNLVTNAVKFTPKGGIVTIKLESQLNEAVIAVKDSGVGIPADVQSNIFEPFSTSGRFGTSNERPSGLGLSISQKIVEQHSGKLWFESEEKKGSTFFLSLPKSTTQDSNINK